MKEVGEFTAMTSPSDLTSGRSKSIADGEEEKKEDNRISALRASYPVEFTYAESCRLNEDIRRINFSLDNIFKGTQTMEPVGQIEDDREELSKMQGQVEPKDNPYDDLELTYDKTNLMNKIITTTGFTAKKDAKKGTKGDTTSPKQTGKKAAGGKSTAKKKQVNKDVP